MTELIFVRHGETDNNKQGVLQGHLDISLNKKGKAEAIELANNLKEIKIDEIYSSDLNRSLLCAEEIIKFFPNLNIIKESLLRERDFGDHQGKIVTTLGYPDITYSSMVRHLYECDCPNGETNSQLLQRINSFLKKINSVEDKKILVVTHGGTLMLALNHILKEEIKTENAKKHKNGYVSFLSLDKDLKIKNSLINVHSKELVRFLNTTTLSNSQSS